MKKTGYLPKKLQESLDELRRVEELANDMASADADIDTTLKPSINMVEEIKKQMKKPIWKMTTHNKLSGGMKHHIFNYVFDIGFILDTKTLFNSIDSQLGLQNSDVQTYLNSEETLDREVKDIVVESLLPRSFGLSTFIKVREWIPVDDHKNKAEVFSKIEWPLTMTVINEIVQFDYVAAFNYLLFNNVLIKKDHFRDEVWAHMEFFRGRNAFSQSYHLDEEDLIISIEVNFEPVKEK